LQMTEQNKEDKQKQPFEAGEAAEHPIESPEYMLLHGTFPPLEEMNEEDLRKECEMWRRLWAWIPSEVKYYVARTGKLVGVTRRDYKRYIGVLLETHWDLKSFDLGVADKVYDNITGQWFYEKKIIRFNASNIIDWQWIEERKTEKELIGEESPPPESEELA